MQDLERLGQDKIDLAYLIENKIVAPNAEVLRVLGKGEITKAVEVQATYATKSAAEKIAKAGGKVELV